MSQDFTRKIIDLLYQKTPDPRIELVFSNAFELLIATILAAQCTDARVNMVTRTFFKEYPNPEKLANANVDVIAEKIKSTGFYRNKAKALIACCQQLIKVHEGQVPDTLKELSSLPGVGRKTANVIVGNAFNKPAIIVDTHVKRVTGRLGLTMSVKPDKIEQDLIKVVDKDSWTLFSQLVVLHGRYVCKARNPKCVECVLYDICPWDEKVQK